MEKIDKAIHAIEKGKLERCQEKLAEDKKIFLKQQKLLRIADMEEDEWEVVKCYLSDNLAYDSEEEKQLSRARRDAAANKKKREANKQKDKKETVSKCLPPRPLSEKIQSVLPVDKKDIFNISAQIEETETTVNSDRDWEISDKTEEISVRGRLKENSHF